MIFIVMEQIAHFVRSMHQTRDTCMSVISACWLLALMCAKTCLESPWFPWFVVCYALLIIVFLCHKTLQRRVVPCAVPGARLRESSRDVACGPDDTRENLPALPENLPRVVQRAIPCARDRANSNQPAGSVQMQTNLDNVLGMQEMLERDIILSVNVREMFRSQALYDYTKFVRNVSDAVFNGAGPLEVESMWFAYRHLRDMNHELAQRSDTRIQNASRDSYMMWSQSARL